MHVSYTADKLSFNCIIIEIWLKITYVKKMLVALMNIIILKFDIKFLYNFCIYSDFILYFSKYLEFINLNYT